MDKNPELLVSIQGASEILGVHPETLRRWDRSGKLVAVKVGTRGDRRYRVKDLMKVKSAATPLQHDGFEIIPWSLGFEPFPDRFGTVSSFVVRGENKVAGFAFAVGGLDMFASPNLSEENLRGKALSIITDNIDAKAIINGKEYLFEFKSGNFYTTEHATWWKKGDPDAI